MSFFSSMVTGVLLAASFPPSPVPWLVFVCLIYFVRLWRAMNLSDAYLHGFLVYASYFLVAGGFALAHPVSVTAFVSFLGLLLYALYYALIFVIPGWIQQAAGFKRWTLGPLVVCAWIVFESSPWLGPLQFPWLTLGYTLIDLPSLSGSAAVVGVSGLGAAVLSVNLLLESGLRHGFGKSGARALAAALLVLILLGTGSSCNRHPLNTASTDSTSVLFVQPGMDALEWSGAQPLVKAGTLISLSEAVVKNARLRPDLILWPETALSLSDGRVDDRADSLVQSWVNQTGIALVTGAVRRSTDSSLTNSALYFSPHAPMLRYDKVHLVPFAEYVPGESALPYLNNLSLPSGGKSTYSRGKHPVVWETEAGSVMPMICFESIFGDFAATGVRDGAEWIAVLAQDGWWGNSLGYQQHLAITRMRAIESGRYIVQATVSGISALIHPDGQFSKDLGWMEKQAQVVSVARLSGSTPRVRFGDVTFWLFAVVLAFSMAIGVLRVARARLARFSGNRMR